MADLMRDTFHGVDPGAGLDYLHSKDDAGQHVEFYRNEIADKDYCRMIFPGDKQKVWDQPVREKDKQRFPRQWSLYQRGLEQTHGQTLLTAWAGVTPGDIEIYRSVNIVTVEQLAALPDGNMQNMPPGHGPRARRQREMAQAFLQEQQQSAGFDKAAELAAESQQAANAALAENAELREQLAELQRRVEGAGQAEITADNDAPAWPKHHGGPYYLCSDGTKVKGKDAANQHEASLAS